MGPFRAHFWSITCETTFSSIWELTTDANNSLNIHYTPNPAKNNNKRFQNNQKTIIWGYFGPNLGPFRAVTCKQEFSLIWELTRETNNHFNLHSKPNPVKTNDKIFRNNEKTLILGLFGPILPNLGQIRIFLKNPFLPVFFNSG